MLEQESQLARRVLVLMPTFRDAERTVTLCKEAALDAAICADVAELCREMRLGAGAVVLTDDALLLDTSGQLAEAAREQPAWSNLPFLVLAREGSNEHLQRNVSEALTNLTIVERPVRTHSLRSLLASALRSRQHQYEIRDALRELQASREELARQAEQLREADRRKDAFLATLAHELRNPLAPIRTGVELLRSDDAASARVIEVIGRQLAHMVRLVDDLLDVSRITRGKLELKRARITLADAVAAAVEASRPTIEREHHTLTVQLPDEPLALDADLTRIAQVIGNLLNNASKYTPQGGHIELSAHRDGAQVVIAVRDDGIGIPEDQQEHVFEMFGQVNRTLDRQQGGLGIGLALVRQLVELHGGSVSVSSAGAEAGTVFELRLPLVLTSALAPSALPDVAATQVATRILVVDDNEDAAEMISRALRRAGHETAVAFDGPSALREVASWQPEVVLLDIGLPGMSGYEVARALREQHGALTLIALTGWGSSEDRKKAVEAGFDLHLTKPVGATELREALLALAAR
jgi:signal transduction histidine kinase/CheY-like chemotaxis protein